MEQKIDLFPLLDKAHATAHSKLEHYCIGTEKSYSIYIDKNQKGPEIAVEIYDTSRDKPEGADMSPPQNVVDYVLGQMPRWAGKGGEGLTFKLRDGIKPTASAVQFRPSGMEIT